MLDKNMDCWKVSYPSKKHALAVIKRRKKTGILIASNTYVYQCPHCNNWHIGHDKFYTEKKGQFEMEIWSKK